MKHTSANKGEVDTMKKCYIYMVD